MNGDLDLSEAQNGGVKYEMRTLKFTFRAKNCSYERWSGLLSQIASDLQESRRESSLTPTRDIIIPAGVR